jgi:phenylpropionate dioxygenase-like ring-hydroxylating dioxygenase large terminal subunit
MSKTLDLDSLDLPKPSYQAILDRDGDRVPDVLRLRRNPIPNTDPIDFTRYTSPEFFTLEMDRMWSRVWQFACREEHVAEPGDYTVYEIGRQSLVIVRDEQRRLHAYYNSCLHRGTKLKERDSCGHSPSISCPYHGWTWSLDGQLANVPCAWDFPHLDRALHALPEARIDTWNGLVFVSFAETGPTLPEYLEVIPEHFRSADWDMTDWYVGVHARKELPCNWKAAQDAFIEGYHTNLVHPQCVGTAGDINAQHDIFGDHVSRDLVALGVSSPSMKVPLSDQQILDTMLMGDASGGRPRLKDGETARSVMAGALRAQLRDQFGLDLSKYSNAEVIDSIKYTLFPNLFIFAGISVRILYVYRPLGMDPDRCTFDILFLRPIAQGAERPPPAEVVVVPEEGSYRDVPGMDPGWGELFDQDTSILRRQRDGMHASKRKRGVYSAYLESRLRHIQHTLDKYIGA